MSIPAFSHPPLFVSEGTSRTRPCSQRVALASSGVRQRSRPLVRQSASVCCVGLHGHVCNDVVRAIGAADTSQYQETLCRFRRAFPPHVPDPCHASSSRPQACLRPMLVLDRGLRHHRRSWHAWRRPYPIFGSHGSAALLISVSLVVWASCPVPCLYFGFVVPTVAAVILWIL